MIYVNKKLQKNAAEKQVQNDSDSNSDVEEEVNEEKFTSIEDEPKQEKVRREAKQQNQILKI